MRGSFDIENISCVPLEVHYLLGNVNILIIDQFQSQLDTNFLSWDMSNPKKHTQIPMRDISLPYFVFFLWQLKLLWSHHFTFVVLA